MGLADPRTVGSKNPGATNVLRVFGKGPAIIALAGDLLKGLLPVLAARALGFDAITVAATGVAAFAGHLFPVFFGFRGGKGVATFIGVLFGFHWMVGACFITVWLLMAALFRISSLAALTATLVIPVTTYFLEQQRAIVIAVTLMALAVIIRHRGNIRNLLAGAEGKIGKHSS